MERGTYLSSSACAQDINTAAGRRRTCRGSYLVEEDVLAVAAIDGEGLEDAIRCDAVLNAQLLPELGANWRWSEG